MQKCLIVINKNAGGAKKISPTIVQNYLGDGYQFSTAFLPCSPIDFSPFDTVAVCGGDGTLSSILQQLYDKNVTIYYFPIGTLNDKAKAKRYHKEKPCATQKIECEDCVLGKYLLCAESEKTELGVHTIIGKVGDDIFTYVLAAGSFTPIGYKVNVKAKQKFGMLAYLCAVLKEYKIHRINATCVTDDGTKIDGQFSLFMCLKSPRCFGFHFNRAYDENKMNGHLVAIRSPKHNGLLGKIEMFFPFFRVFFLGLKKEMNGKIIFKSFRTLSLTVDTPTNFCLDGEKLVLDGLVDITFLKTKSRLLIADDFKKFK